MESEKHQLQNQNKTIDSQATDRTMPSYCMNNIPDAGLVDNWTVGQIIFLSLPPTRDFLNLSHKIAELARQKFDQYVNHVVQTRDRGVLVIYLEKGK